MQQDFKNFVCQQNGKFFSRNKDKSFSLLNQDRALMKIGKHYFLVHYFLINEATGKFSIVNTIFRDWCLEPTILIFSKGTVSKNAFHIQFNPHFKESWGWISYLENPNIILPEFLIQFPINVKNHGIFVITLDNVKDSNKMFHSLYSMKVFLKDNIEILEQIKNNQENIKNNYEKILREGWFERTNGIFLTDKKEPNLKKRDISDSRKYNNVVKIDKSKSPLKELKQIYDLFD